MCRVSPSCITTLIIHQLFLQLLVASSTPLPQTAKVAYNDHCSSVVSEAISTGLPTNSRFFDFSAGYAIGDADKLFRSKTSSNITSNAYFRLHVSLVLETHAPDVLQIAAYLRISTSETAHFDLLGYWSESTGKLCMVGSRLSQGKQGNKISTNVVLKLNFAKKSNMATSLITGTLESLDSVDSPIYFGNISLLAYPPSSVYEYTLIDKASDSCSRIEAEEDAISFQPCSSCMSLQSYLIGIRFLLHQNIDCSSSNCCPITTSHGFCPSFLSLHMIQCAEDGKLHLHMKFSESTSRGEYGQEFVPGMSLIGEGFWDDKNRRLCLVACHVLLEKPNGTFSIGDCSIGLSLWFHSTVTLKNRTSVAGRLWSNKNEKDVGYFSMISFENIGEARDVILPGLMYKYTELDTAQSSFCMMTNDQVVRLGRKRFPRGKFVNDMEFDLTIKDPRANQNLVYYAKIMSIGDAFYGETNYIHSESNRKPVQHSLTYSSNVITKAMADNLHSNHKVWNISYKIFSSQKNTKFFGDMYVEGVYNSKTGRLCMTGCRYVKENITDCQITVNIQLAPLKPKSGEHLNGTITSRRSKLDPLYFDALKVLSHSIDTAQAAESIQRTKFNLILFMISVTFSCICIMAQLLHVKKHPDVLPSISILMLVILTLEPMIPLLLNLGALLFKNQSNLVEVNDFIVIVLEMLAFLLQLYLLQQECSFKMKARCSKGMWIPEKETMAFCLPLYLGGGLLTILISPKFVSDYLSNSYFDAELSDFWNFLTFYAGLLLDGFLLPQIILNIFLNSKNNSKAPLKYEFYIGKTVIRVVPHFYAAYRALLNVQLLNSRHIFATPVTDSYSLQWDIIIPWVGVLFAVIIFLQQRYEGTPDILPARLEKLKE